MGPLTGQLTVPPAPVRGVAWVAEQTDRRLCEQGSSRRELLGLGVLGPDYDDCKLDGQDRQDVLIRRLAISQARRPEGREEQVDG
jgi:hypothetical protein